MLMSIYASIYASIYLNIIYIEIYVYTQYMYDMYYLYIIHLYHYDHFPPVFYSNFRWGHQTPNVVPPSHLAPMAELARICLTWRWVVVGVQSYKVGPGSSYKWTYNRAL